MSQNPVTATSGHSASSTSLHVQGDDELAKSFATTTTMAALGQAVSSWGQKNSLWPLPYGTACCGIELLQMGTLNVTR